MGLLRVDLRLNVIYDVGEIGCFVFFFEIYEIWCVFNFFDILIVYFVEFVESW